MTGVQTCALPISSLDLTVVGPTSSILYSVSPTSTTSGGIIAGWTCTAGANGTLRIRLTVADGLQGYAVEIDVIDTSITIKDRVASSTLATVSVSNVQLSILVGINNGKIQVWYREAGDADFLRPWISALSTTTLSDAAGSTYTTNLVEWGQIGRAHV